MMTNATADLNEQVPATREQFEEVSTILRAIAEIAYRDQGPQSQCPALMAVLCRTKVDGKHVVKVLPVDMLQSEELGDMGKNLIALMMSRTASEPDTLVVGYISEAWTSQTPGVMPSQAADRQEVVLLNLMSAECQALQTCPITRGDTVTLQVGELMFSNGTTTLRGRFARNPAAGGAAVH